MKLKVWWFEGGSLAVFERNSEVLGTATENAQIETEINDPNIKNVVRLIRFAHVISMLHLLSF